MTEWDDFEPYKGPEKKALPPWLEKIIIRAGIAVGLLVVGCVGGVVAIFLPAVPYGTRRWLVKATEGDLWILGGFGAAISIMAVVSWSWDWPVLLSKLPWRMGRSQKTEDDGDKHL
jgi:hypothetical protein